MSQVKEKTVSRQGGPNKPLAYIGFHCLLPIILALAVLPTGAQTFTYTTISFPGAIVTEPLGINSQGDIVGFYQGGPPRGFLLRQGAFTLIDVPGSSDTAVLGINPQGDMVGRFVAGGVAHGFLLRQGVFTTIDFPGSSLTWATGINPAGDIVGRYNAPGVFGGFLLSQGIFTSIGFPGVGVASGINPAGHIVGGYFFAGASHGYLLRQGAFTTIDFPGAVGTDARGINPAGDIVGLYASGEGGIENHGFLLSRGAFTTIDFPGGDRTVATGVNPQVTSLAGTMSAAPATGSWLPHLPMQPAACRERFQSSIRGPPRVFCLNSTRSEGTTRFLIGADFQVTASYPGPRASSRPRGITPIGRDGEHHEATKECALGSRFSGDYCLADSSLPARVRLRSTSSAPACAGIAFFVPGDWSQLRARPSQPKPAVSLCR